LPPGKSVIERIDALGRAGQVSESVVRFQNQEMAKADVAFEVLSRYFARQIIEILDATDPGDREIREREMRGLEQFFGMGIVDKAQGTGSSVLDMARQRVSLGGIGAGEGQQTVMGQPAPVALGSFPQVGSQAFPTAPAMVTPQQGSQQGLGQPPPPPPVASGPPRDWTKMLSRVRTDIERICSFLEALAKHPRGLQKYHEEAVRTVHDSWIDREGEQSLRRWVRSECARVWPHKFAAIEAEKERARADIAALEELFGVREVQPASPTPQQPSARAPARA
jgi:hypothetical protein